MLTAFGERQRQLLSLLLTNKAGMSVDEIATVLEVTRTAVNQHLAVLERDGYICRVEQQKTAGRPVTLYALTESGIEIFPKQYSWFSGLLIKTLKDELGSEGLTRYLRKIAQHLAGDLRDRLEGKSGHARIEELVAIMNDLAYEAKPLSDIDTGAGEGIKAYNCVYHEIAREYPEICQFDLALLSELTGKDVEHEECMALGGHMCRFRFVDK